MKKKVSMKSVNFRDRLQFFSLWICGKPTEHQPDLSKATLVDADLSGATLASADLSKVKDVPVVLPE